MKLKLMPLLLLATALMLLVGCGGSSDSQDNASSKFPDPMSTTSDLNEDHPEDTPAQSESPTRSPIDRLGSAKCTGSGPVKFANSPMRIEDIKLLIPYGLVIGAHITPIDHMYFEPKDRSLGRDVYEVRAIQDAVIFDMQPRDISVETNEEQSRDWRIDMAHTCTFTSYFDLLTSLAPDIEEEWAITEGGMKERWDGIFVKAGQLIGYVGAQTLDFGVYDYEVQLPGFVNPSAYANLEPWKIHTVDPFQHFPDTIRDALLSKMIRKVEPRAGKIDHDVDGALAGNWFQVDTNWYDGINRRKYWDGHLSIAPHEIEPTLWRISVGFLDRENNHFIIVGEHTPSDIISMDKPVSYELKKYSLHIPSQPEKNWWSDPYSENDVYGVKIRRGFIGTVLLQLQEDDLLKLEVFLGKRQEEIDGFTNNSRLYRR
jgi:hypothetical protein